MKAHIYLTTVKIHITYSTKVSISVPVCVVGKTPPPSPLSPPALTPALTMSSFEESLHQSNTSPLRILIIGFGVVGKGVLVGLQKHFQNVHGIVLDAK